VRGYKDAAGEELRGVGIGPAVRGVSIAFGVRVYAFNVSELLRHLKDIKTPECVRTRN
jgi:hypothetical protein